MFMQFDNRKSDPCHKLKLIIDIGISEQKTIKYNASALLDNEINLLNCEGFTSDSFNEFKTKEGIINYFIQIVNNIYTESDKIFLNKRKTEDYLELSQIIICLPDSIIAKNYNMFAEEQNNSNNQDTETLKEKLKQTIITDINLKFTIINNTAGVAIYLAKQLLNDKKYKDRFEQQKFAVTILTDNNFGVFSIKIKDNDCLEIGLNESNNLAFNSSENEFAGILENSVKNLITNYAINLGIINEKKIEALVNTGKTGLVLKKGVGLDKNKDDDAIFSLMETGIYKTQEVFWNNVFLRVDESNPEAMHKFTLSRSNAINQYIEALSGFIYYKIKEGASMFILNGKLMKRINAVFKDAVPRSLASTLEIQISNKINEFMQRELESNNITKLYNFEIILDENIIIDKNIISSNFLQNYNIQFIEPNYGKNSIYFPIYLLKNNP